MQVVIVYESMFGSTRKVAERVGVGLEPFARVVEVLPTGAVSVDDLAWADLLVVGGPTHLGTMSSAGTRAAARVIARTSGEAGDHDVVDLTDEDHALDKILQADLPTVGPGLRRWFHGLPRSHGRVAAAFDTRLPGERGAAGVIARRLGRHGYRVLSAEGFVVEELTGPIGPDELERAEQWGADLAHQVVSALPR